MKIFLDFGHGGSDSGAVSDGLVEKNMNLTTGLECKRVLEQHGIEVGASRMDDRYVGLSERANMANSWGADYFVAIHHNSGGGDGVEVIHSIRRGKGEALAKAIVNAINRETGQNLRPIPTYSRTGSDGRDYYAVIRETSMDAIIVECGFIDNGDRVLFDTVEEQQKMGRAIAYGILEHLGIAVNKDTNGTGDDEGTDNVSSNGGYGIVTADVLNIRSGRGTNYPIIGQLKLNDKVKLLWLLNNWWSIDVPLSVSSSGVGFVSADFIEKTADGSSQTSLAGTSKATYGVVTANVLNIRSGRGTNYPIIGKLKYNNKVKLLWLLNNWWSIDVPLSVSSLGLGYVSADYIKKL
ncbi:N-acetylmuramoyl-L-alanine amidase [Clostridium tunisiense]|uniref:N-acetylmuramoyl-L-alanine amidase n=1 Tax=Clostridium tunisiense TaxID=219748 RepID=UPI0002DAB511|nr:N-acetylmuramoyl-L-alanine amidase [Clostridium tunisiense]